MKHVEDSRIKPMACTQRKILVALRLVLQTQNFDLAQVLFTWRRYCVEAEARN
jgi:hypothetical protein